MKFIIATYRPSQLEYTVTGNKFVARCKPFPWVKDSLSVGGSTREGAIVRMERIIQQHLDTYGSEFDTCEVELEVSKHVKEVDLKLGFGSGSPQTQVPTDLHQLTFSTLADSYAEVERKGQKVVDLWMCEAHFDELRSLGISHLQELVEEGEIRCKLWGARLHVSWTIPMNTFVVIGSGDAELFNGIVPQESQLTHF